MTQAAPVIILVQTQLPENLGAVARAMGNFGFSELRLVSPHILPSDPKAVAMAVGAAPILENAKIFETLNEAVYGLTHLFATTAHERQMIKPYYTPKQFCHWIQENNVSHNQLGLVFGPERTGLSNEDLVWSHGIITIPVSTFLPSLNLAQAVCVVAYEWYSNTNNLPSSDIKMHLGETVHAPVENLINFLKFLEKKLDNSNFWRVPEKKEIMWRNIRNIFTRHTLTHQDIQTLYGLIEAINNVHPQEENKL